MILFLHLKVSDKYLHYYTNCLRLIKLECLSLPISSSTSFLTNCLILWTNLDLEGTYSPSPISSICFLKAEYASVSDTFLLLSNKSWRWFSLQQYSIQSNRHRFFKMRFNFYDVDSSCCILITTVWQRCVLIEQLYYIMTRIALKGPI